MTRDWGTYRKLFEHPTPAFERLPYVFSDRTAKQLRAINRIFSRSASVSSFGRTEAFRWTPVDSSETRFGWGTTRAEHGDLKTRQRGSQGA